MYEQYCLMKYSDADILAFSEQQDTADLYSYYWLKLEIVSFYMYICAAILFLFYIQMRGIFGLDDEV